MCRFRHGPHRNRRVDTCPRHYVDRSILVSVGGIPARQTEKHGLRLPVGLIAVSTAATGARSKVIARLRLQEFKLTLACAKEHLSSAGKRPNRDTKLVQLPLRSAVVVGNRALRGEGAKRLFIQLVGVRDLSFTPHDHLRRKAKAFFGVLVTEPMEGKLPKRLCVPRELTQPATRLIRPFRRRQKRSVLFGSRQKAYFGGQLHPSSTSQAPTVERKPRGYAALHPTHAPSTTEVAGVQGAYPL